MTEQGKKTDQTMSTKLKKYYVYELADSRNQSVFYVGKGAVFVNKVVASIDHAALDSCSFSA